MKNKYQKALDNLVYCKSITKCKECRHKNVCTMERDSKVLQELINKETPMEVDKNDYMICENVDDDYDYFPVSVHLYKCPNTRCNLYKRYKLNFKEKRCSECNQLLDWGGKKNEKNK